MGWRDAQAKVNAGAYKPKKDVFGDVAQGFASAFVPVYTKRKEEERAEDRKKREQEARRSAAAASASAAADRAAKKNMRDARFLMNTYSLEEGQLPFILEGIGTLGVAGTSARLEKNFSRTRTTEAASVPAAPTTMPSSMAELAPANQVGVFTGTQNITGPKQMDDLEATQPQVEDSTEQAITNPLAYSPEPFDISPFLGQTVEEINDHIEFNSSNMSPEAISTLQNYSNTVAKRNPTLPWYEDRETVDNLETPSLIEELKGVEEGSEAHNKITSIIMSRNKGKGPNDVLGMTSSEIDTYLKANSSLIDEEDNQKITSIREMVVLKETNEEYYNDPVALSKISVEGLQLALQSAPPDSTEYKALNNALSIMTEGVDLESLVGKSSSEYDQFYTLYKDKIIEQGLQSKFDLNRSSAVEKERVGATVNTLNAKQLRLNALLASSEYADSDEANKDQLLKDFEVEWKKGTDVAERTSYTQANFDSDFIKYSEIIRDVGLGQFTGSDEEVAAARRWMTVTKPIAEEQLQPAPNAQQQKFNILVEELGIEPELARKLSLGLIDVRTDEVTRQTVLVDLTTGKVLSFNAAPSVAGTADIQSVLSTDTPVDPNAPTLTTSTDDAARIEALNSFANELASGSPGSTMGFSGWAKTSVNNISAFVGRSPGFEDVQTSNNLINTLGILTETSLNAAFPILKDSVYLKKRLLELAPKTGVLQSPENARTTTENMISFLDDQIVKLKDIEEGKVQVNPATLSNVRVRLPEIETLKSYYEAFMSSIDAEQGDTRNASSFLKPLGSETPPLGTLANPYTDITEETIGTLKSGDIFIAPDGSTRTKN